MSTNAVVPTIGLDEHPPVWHLAKFIEFVRFKDEVGEPSPHLQMTGAFFQGEPNEAVVWGLGCYAAVYNLPTAQILWTYWSQADVLRDPTALQRWLTDRWGGIDTRRERRCVRTPAKLTRCLYGYAQWAATEYPRLLALRTTGLSADRYYDYVWESVTKVPFLGRYIAIRLIEGLRRFADLPALLYDVRSLGGWSPKQALTYFAPTQAELLLSPTRAGDQYTDLLAYDVLRRARKFLPSLSTYVLAAMLCEYRVCYEKRGQYPGCTLDQELHWFARAQAYWGADFASEAFLRIRTQLFPSVALGEQNGWTAPRKPLGGALHDYGYNWSDLRYVYTPDGDLQRPERRGGVRTTWPYVAVSTN